MRREVRAEASGHCPRCDDVVPLLMPWAPARPLFWAWCTIAFVLAVLLPFYFVDVCVSVPAAMLVALAGGPIVRLARERPVCSVCSLELDALRAGGTGIRLRPHRPRADVDAREP